MTNKAKPPPVKKERLILKLYVSGMSLKSMEAIRNVNKLCSEYLAGNFDLEIIDIYKNPEEAGKQQIIFSPSLIKILPLPRRILIGTFSDIPKVVKALGVNYN